MRRPLLILLLTALLTPSLHAQELIARVSIQPPAISGMDFTLFNQMQKDVQDYLNRNRFTELNYEPLERIQIQVNIVITAMPQGDLFEGTMQVQAKRPVYNSSYETLLLNFNDKNFRANYVQNQPIQFSENTYMSNLSSILNFYAYVVIGLDCDSFSPEGGAPYFEMAWNQMNLAASNNQPGWQAIGSGGGGRQNRYWLVENLRNNSYKSLHTILFRYHREGLDKMSEDVNGGRTVVLECVQELHKLSTQNLNMPYIRIFLDTKSQQSTSELVEIMRKGRAPDKQKFVQMMTQIDPSNASVYASVLQEPNPDDPNDPNNQNNQNGAPGFNNGGSFNNNSNNNNSNGGFDNGGMNSGQQTLPGGGTIR